MTTINSNRKPLVCGVGINDANYTVVARVSGKEIRCVFYDTWRQMLNRCYLPSSRTRYPTYKDCTVAVEWHSFMTFRKWMIKQDWRGYALDKDLLAENNKIYSPDTCVFISHELNNILLTQSKNRGKYPVGVYKVTLSSKYRAQIRINNVTIHLGSFSTIDEAKAAYDKARSIKLRKSAFEQSDHRLAKALMRHASCTVNSCSI